MPARAQHRCSIAVDSLEVLSRFCGPNNSTIAILERVLDVSIFIAGSSIEILSDAEGALRDCKKICEYLLTCTARGVQITREFVASAANQLLGIDASSADERTQNRNSNGPKNGEPSQPSPRGVRARAAEPFFASSENPADAPAQNAGQNSAQNPAAEFAARENAREISLSAHAENGGIPSISIPSTKTTIVARTRGQAEIIRALNEFDLSFLVGPAGTGKTFFATAYALARLLQKKAQRFIITRPIVEAGEQLGFLPGDLVQKTLPYLRPIYDALHEAGSTTIVQHLQEHEAIEIAPLAYMRGRTLRNCTVLLDEAQNCTIEQMKMFLTRIGENTKVIVTGDLSQSDLPKKTNGLQDALAVFADVPQAAIVRLSEKDVQRSGLAKIIVEAYNRKQ